MNSEVVIDVSEATLAGRISFPEVVRRLLETGVEYYHVDYAALRKTFYGSRGDVVTTPINFDRLPPIAETL